MCIKDTISKMLEISILISRLQMQKITALGDGVIGTLNNSAGLSAGEIEMTEEQFDSEQESRAANDALKAFMLIMDLLLEAEDVSEKNVAARNAASYCKLLAESVTGYPGFVRQAADVNAENKYREVLDNYTGSAYNALTTELTVCKNRIFKA